MAVYRDMYGASAPSSEMAASIHEHFYEQMQLVPKMKKYLIFMTCRMTRLALELERILGSLISYES